MNRVLSFSVYVLGAFSQDWIMWIFAIKMFHNECRGEGAMPQWIQCVLHKPDAQVRLSRTGVNKARCGSGYL